MSDTNPDERMTGPDVFRWMAEAKSSLSDGLRQIFRDQAKAWEQERADKELLIGQLYDAAGKIVKLEERTRELAQAIRVFVLEADDKRWQGEPTLGRATSSLDAAYNHMRALSQAILAPPGSGEEVNEGRKA